MVGGIYREQHLLQPNAIRGTVNLTGSPEKQLERWTRIVKAWKAAAKDQKCVVIGDMNLDHAKWHDPEPRHARMVDIC